MKNHFCYAHTLPIYIVIIGMLGCGGCGTSKEVGKNNTGIGKGTQTENSSKTPAQLENAITFPSDFPKIDTLPDHLPNAEMIMDKEGLNAYMFNEHSKFIGIVNIEKIREKDPISGFINDFKDKKGGRVFVINENRQEISTRLKICGFDIPKNIMDKISSIDCSGGNARFFNGDKSPKIIGYIFDTSILMHDKEGCIYNINLCKIYNYKNELVKILTQKDVGGNLILSKNQTLGLSEYSKCDCDAYEPDCILSHFRYNNFTTGYIFDFNPLKDDKFDDYRRSIPDQCVVLDSLIILTFGEGLKFLRVAIEPYNKNIYAKEYITDVDYNGKYGPYEFFMAFKNEKLPDGSPEDYKSYQLIEQNK